MFTISGTVDISRRIGDITKDLEANKTSRKWRRTWPQHLAAILASLGAMSGAMILGWSSVVQPYLHGEDTAWTGEEMTLNRTLPALSDYDNNLVGALAYIGAIFGSLFSGEIADSLGRRRFLLATAVPYMICWMMIMTTELLPVLLTSQFIAGIALGVTTTITPMYIEEIAEDGIRGALEVYMDILFTVGTFVIYVVGAYLSYFWLSVASVSVPLIFFLTFYFMPESPVYLLHKGERDNAEKALKWLRGSSEDALDEDIEKGIVNLEKLLASFSAIDTTPLLTRILHVPFFVKDVIFNIDITPATVRATAVVCGLMVFQQLCGLDAIIKLSVSLMQGRTKIINSQYMCYVIVTSIELVAVVISAFVIDRLGRRILLLISGVFMIMCLTALAVNSFLHDCHEYPWALIFISNIYIIAFYIGVGPVPFVLCAELSPIKERSMIEPLANFINWMMSFFVNQYLGDYLSDMGGLQSYSVSCILCVIGTWFVYFWVPETKLKSRDDIQTALVDNESTSASSRC